MRHSAAIAALVLTAATCLQAFAAPAAAQAAAAAPAAAKLPADPWPREVSICQRRGAGLPAAGQQVGRQPDRLPRRAGDQADGAKDENLRRDLRHRAHAGRQGHAHGGVREPAASPRSTSRRCPTAERRTPPSCRHSSPRTVRTISLDRLRGVARAGRHQAADGRGAEHAAAGDRQLLAGDPGADRRRAGAEAGAGPSACAARHQHPGADPAGRLRRQLLHPRLRRLAAVELDHRSVDAGDTRAVDRRARWTPSRRRCRRGRHGRPARRRAQGRTRSRRSPTACRRSTPARCRPS